MCDRYESGGYSKRRFLYQGVGLPLDSGHLSKVNKFNCSAVETAVAASQPTHPYLLFRIGEIRRIRNVAKKKKVWARLLAALNEPYPIQVKESREGLKRRARRLINTSFLSLIADGPESDKALKITKNLLYEFISTPNWSYRPVIKSFLDRAEAAVAVSLAYDWLYDKLLPFEREEIEQ